MSTENEEFDISQSMAAELTGSVGMDDVGNDMPGDVATDVTDHETWQAEKDIPVSNDVDDTRQGELDREDERDQAQQRGKKVPLAALHEERTRRQQAEAQLQVERQQMAQLQAQWQAAQQVQLQAQHDAAVPDFDSDPRAYIEYREKQFAQQLEQLQNGPAQQQLQIQQVEALIQQEAAVIGPAVSEVEANFAATHPDYPQALDHLQQTVNANIRAQHPGATDQQLRMLQTAVAVEYAKTCQAQGINIAEHAYQRAHALGFKAASRAPRKDPPTSLSNMHGSARAPDEKGAITGADIANMSEAEFDKYWAGMRRDSAIGPKF
nr:hypothetical protein [uncultured Pseudomonas sp.]